MLTKLEVSLLAALGCGAAGCGDDPQGFVRWLLDEYGAPTQTKDPIRPAQRYRDLHAAAPSVMDLHADTLVQADDDGAPPYERLLSNADRDGHVDVPRLIQGNVALQVFSVFSKGSVDIIGDDLPLITGECDYTPEGCDRALLQRDADVLEHDDPDDPHDVQYAPYFLDRRDPVSYVYRVLGRPCRTWFGSEPWGEFSVWGPPPAGCPDYDPQREFLERLLVHADRLSQAAALDSRLELVRSRGELTSLLSRRATNKNLVGALLSTEGLYFRSDASAAGQQRLHGYFRELYNAGFRMFGLTHHVDNDHGGSSTGIRHKHDPEGGSLTAAGEQFARLALTHGAVLDVAHASKHTLLDLVALAQEYEKPLVYSHGGVRQAFSDPVCNNRRNIDDEEVVAIASTGGVVGIGYAESFNCDIAPSAFAAAVRHAVNVIDAARLRVDGAPGLCDAQAGASSPARCRRGVQHVGLGSDFDGGVETYTDTANLEQYTRALRCERTLFTPSCLAEPFDDAEVHAILGGNVKRVLEAVLPATVQTL